MQSQVLDGNDLWAVREGRSRRSAGRAPARDRVARVPDLPPLRPLQVRPGEVPADRGGGALARARPAASRARDSSTSGLSEDDLAGKDAIGAQMERAVENAPRARPFDPAQDGASEFKG